MFLFFSFFFSFRQSCRRECSGCPSWSSSCSHSSIFLLGLSLLLPCPVFFLFLFQALLIAFCLCCSCFCFCCSGFPPCLSFVFCLSGNLSGPDARGAPLGPRHPPTHAPPSVAAAAVAHDQLQASSSTYTPSLSDKTAPWHPSPSAPPSSTQQPSESSASLFQPGAPSVGAPPYASMSAPAYAAISPVSPSSQPQSQPQSQAPTSLTEEELRRQMETDEALARQLAAEQL